MCGVVGIVSKSDVSKKLLESLRKLEYRGYDSVGMVCLQDNAFTVKKDIGKIDEVDKKVDFQTLKGNVGMAHCRWSTHGGVTQQNAHPHTSCNENIAVVHNGIIENYAQIKTELIQAGHNFSSETDTEVIVHLIESHYETDLLSAVQKALKELVGAYAIGVMDIENPNLIVAARSGCPLVIGIGKDENYFSSDIPALLSYTKKFIFVEDGDIVSITPQDVTITNSSNEKISREIQTISWDAQTTERKGYEHFMLKEIHEQPNAVIDTLNGRIKNGTVELELKNTPSLASFSRIILVGCGTSWHAALIGEYMIEELAKIPVEVEYASEFRYRKPILDKSVLVVAISQSGETADTLAAIREAKERGAFVISIVNALGSTIARESHDVLYTHAGPEIGVASTKAFTSQITLLYLFAAFLGIKRNELSQEKTKEALTKMRKIPLQMEVLLKRTNEVKALADDFSHHTNALYLGRGPNYPIALEGALKLKEVSYIHAEGYPAAEMKHGPIALIDENMPVIFIATQDQSYQKILSNIEEIKARKGHVIAVASDGDEYLKTKVDHVLYVPRTDDLLLPLLTVIPLQLLAYYVALNRKCDVDCPRHLAKAVCTE